MNRVIILCLSLFLFSGDALPQKNINKTSFFAGPQVSVAAGSLSKTHTWGLGANAQVVHPINVSNSIVGQVSYTYLFGKKFSSGSYEPGGGGSYNYNYKSKGMSDVSLTGGLRHNFTSNLYGGVGAGLCVDIGNGSTDASYDAQFDFGYLCSSSPLVQAFSAFLGICGDPKLQIGLRYAIRL